MRDRQPQPVRRQKRDARIGEAPTVRWPTPSPTCHRRDAVFGADRFRLRGWQFRGLDAIHEDGVPPDLLRSIVIGQGSVEKVANGPWGFIGQTAQTQLALLLGMA